jgi:hypothetical protein
MIVMMIIKVGPFKAMAGAAWEAATTLPTLIATCSQSHILESK